MVTPRSAFHFNTALKAWICPKHGDVGDNTAWVNCWTGCQDGFFDDYEDDPILNEPGDMSACVECGGNGGFMVCGECNIDNPDAEY